jgi:hypothetical protein
MTRDLQTFVNRCLRKHLRYLGLKLASNEELWMHAQEKPVAVRVELRKWEGTGCTLRKESSAIVKKDLSWNHQGQRRRGGP